MVSKLLLHSSRMADRENEVVPDMGSLLRLRLTKELL